MKKISMIINQEVQMFSNIQLQMSRNPISAKRQIMVHTFFVKILKERVEVESSCGPSLISINLLGSDSFRIFLLPHSEEVGASSAITAESLSLRPAHALHEFVAHIIAFFAPERISMTGARHGNLEAVGEDSRGRSGVALALPRRGGRRLQHLAVRTASVRIRYR